MYIIIYIELVFNFYNNYYCIPIGRERVLCLKSNGAIPMLLLLLLL